ncbi:MAG: MBL fold metallo-hydrolase [Victivallales bacterium]|nr:MBL fold metallo-hydrolase [Victivallales bacterium]
MPGKIVILGSGTSYGVPVIGCDCPVCRSTAPQDKRTRAAAWIVGEHGTSIILDVGPDLRQQCLRESINHLDGVLLTHTHADHLHGIDDLRAFTLHDRKPLPLYASSEHCDFIRRHFEYIFQDDAGVFGWGIPRLDLKTVDNAPFELGEFIIHPVPLNHGQWQCTGYRIGNLAYLTDCNGIPETSLGLLQNLDILVIDALRWKPHKTHNSITESLAIVDELKPALTVFTHLSHDICHEKDSAFLPQKCCFAYDGLTLSFS